MIIGTTYYLSSYDLYFLPASFIEAMKRHADKNTPITTLLRLFECYCQVTNRAFDYTTLSRKSFERTLQGFAGAIMSKNFVGCAESSKGIWIKEWTLTLESLRSEVPEMPHPRKAVGDIELCKLVWLTESGDNHQHLDKDAVRYWGSWPVLDKKGGVNYLALSALWHSHGADFVETVHLGWMKAARKTTSMNPTELNRFIAFLAIHKECWPTEAFRDPLKIKRLFATWMTAYLAEGEASGRKFLELMWNRFIEHINRSYIKTGMWAKPFTPFLKFDMKECGPANHKINTRNGIEYQDQLLTEIPLYVTDDQAIEILFRRVKDDIEVVKKWATAMASDLYERVQNRVAQAKYGNIRAIPCSSTPQNAPRSFADHCAAFEHFTLCTKDSEFKLHYGSRAQKEDMAYKLGVPTRGSLLPYQCLLVMEHPCITPNYLYSLEIFEPNGDPKGFLPTDTGYELIGCKDRRKPDHSEMKIQLTPCAAQWIKEIIEITNPLRRALRERGDDAWRLLFLTCGHAFLNPGKSQFTYSPSALKKHHKTREKVTKEFERFTSLRNEELINFISRVTPSKVRASCGVAVYLETHDVTMMAEALGHVRYSRNLLSHYLPESLLAFFQSRWIRIFQRGMLCLAMEGSPYILEATTFSNMNELNEFLKNHAIKDIPEYLDDPEGASNIIASSSERSEKTYISVGTGVLTALLSLEAAVSDAEHPNAVTGTARYWAEFARTVTAAIELDTDGLLHEHLRTARVHCKPWRMEKLIYDAA